MQLSEAVEKLRGEVGSKVTIKVQRGQLEPFDVTIIRDFIKIALSGPRFSTASAMCG